MDETQEQQTEEMTSETSAAQPEQSAKKRRGPKKKEEKYSLVLRVPEHLMLAFGETAEKRKLAAGILDVYSNASAQKRIQRLIELGAGGEVGAMSAGEADAILAMEDGQEKEWIETNKTWTENTEEPGEGEEIILVNTGEEAASA